MPRKNGTFTAKEKATIDAAARGADMIVATRAAGYKFPNQAAYQLSQSPELIAEVRRRHADLVATRLIPLSIAVVEGALLDPKARWGDRLKAADMAWKAFAPAGEAGAKQPWEMTADELAAEIAKQRARLAAVTSMAQDVTPDEIEGEAIEDAEPSEPSAFG